MRSSTLVIVPFYFLAGLVAASADKAHDIELDFEGPPSGWVCCDAGAEDADGACKAKGLNAFCCGPFKARSGPARATVDATRFSQLSPRDVMLNSSTGFAPPVVICLGMLDVLKSRRMDLRAEMFQ
ncbi:hypothetical protein MCOR10_005033 [Pyricularia oryzae]|nr:hypothetical protein MCOR10_005033 [Pyricularia oryzae]